LESIELNISSAPLSSVISEYVITVSGKGGAEITPKSSVDRTRSDEFIDLTFEGNASNVS
jgi:hypothetical protein